MWVQNDFSIPRPRPIQRVPIAPGSNLRKSLLANGFQVMPG